MWASPRRDKRNCSQYPGVRRAGFHRPFTANDKNGHVQEPSYHVTMHVYPTFAARCFQLLSKIEYSSESQVCCKLDPKSLYLLD